MYAFYSLLYPLYGELQSQLIFVCNMARFHNEYRWHKGSCIESAVPTSYIMRVRDVFKVCQKPCGTGIVFQGKYVNVCWADPNVKLEMWRSR